MTAVLHVDNITKRFGGFVALDGIDLEVAPGERLGLIGPNGSGKSTLVNCICGTLQNETGSVVFDGHAIDGLAAHQRTHRGLARSFQLPRPFHSMSVADKEVSVVRNTAQSCFPVVVFSLSIVPRTNNNRTLTHCSRSLSLSARLSSASTICA